MTLWELGRRLDKFDISREVRESIIATSPYIIKLNQGQMFIGRRADGTEILPTYKDSTIEIKKEKGQPYDRVTLKDKGDFWADISVLVGNDSFIIDDTNVKTQSLLKKYGDKVLGLSAASKSEEYIPLYFFPELKGRIEGKLGLKLT